MSVWFTESFRGQVYWDVSRLESISRDQFHEFVKACPIYFNGGIIAETGEFPKVEFPTGFAEDIDHEWLDRVFYDSVRNGRPKLKGGGVTQQLLKTNARFKTGFPAVMRMYQEISKSCYKDATDRAKPEHKFLSLFVEHGFRAQAGMMKTTAEVAEAAANRINHKALLEASVYQQLTHIVRSVINLRWKNQVRKQAQSHPSAMKSLTNFAEDAQLPEDWIAYYDGWMTYIQHPDDPEDEWYALTTVDLDRLQQMLISRGMLSLHEASWSCTAGNDSALYRTHKARIMRIFESAIKKASEDPEFCSELCRDMRKTFNTYLSMAAGSLSDSATDAMMAELRNSKCGKYFSTQKFLAALIDMPFDLAQDLGRIYKLLPAPDYDIGESFASRQKQHLSMNPLNEITGQNPCNLDEFRKYMRKLVIITLVRKAHGKGVGKFKGAVAPRWWKDYMDRGVLPDRLDSVDSIDLTGVATYKIRTEDNPDILKDSAVCEEDIDLAFDDEEGAFKRRNMLLRYLYDNACPTPDKARNGLSRRDHIHRVGFKMEAHKPVSRLFFIGNYSDRIVQSEMEENVHRIALHCPGYMIGQSPEFSTTKIMQMVAPRLAYDEEVFFFNFDISAWSPGMRDDIQRISHAIWGEVFDRMEFKLAHKINEKAVIILNKRGYQAAYINPGANLEGYNGKEMTFLHCALMGYSVYRYRRATHHNVTIPLAAYIDDGLAAFPEKKSIGPTRFLKFAEIVEETYQALGFLLERSKCFMSDSFAIFLNEIYMSGSHITYGLRAVMRVGTSAFEKHETLLARANTYLSGAQGAMKAGLDIISSFIVYLWLIGRMLLVYGAVEFMDARASVLYSFTPRGLGGLGAGSIVSVATNLVVDNTVEGVACIQEMCRAYPAYKPKVCRLLRQDVVEKSDVAKMVAPTSLEAPHASMSENRLSSAVARALMREQLARRAKVLVRLYKGVKIEQLSTAIIGPNVALSAVMLKDLLAATPLALIESLVRKFDSARTMAVLIGPKEFRRITRQNRAEGLLSMANFRKL